MPGAEQRCMQFGEGVEVEVVVRSHPLDNRFQDFVRVHAIVRLQAELVKGHEIQMVKHGQTIESNTMAAAPGDWTA